MRTRGFWCFLGVVLLAGPVLAQPPTKADSIKAEMETLRAQVKVLQAQVEAPQAQMHALQKDLGKLSGPPGLQQQPQDVPPAPADDTDPTITTGVNVLCWYQLIPGVQGAKFPPTNPYEGATIRLLSFKGQKVLQQGKTKKSGRLRLAAPPGKYLLEIVPQEAGEGVRSPIEVTVKKGKLTSVEIITTRPGV